MQKLAGYLLASTALVPLAIGAASANPLDPVVQAGSVTITGEGSAGLNVLQSTDKAIIDWRTFNIGLDETTTFVQPRAQSVLLNRVVGGEGASQILGELTANGQVFLINPDGILFGTDATVDVGSLVATTYDLLNEDFLAGNYDFSTPGNAAASIVNLGTITVEDGGFAALVAPGVRNAGVIGASLGKVGLASADGFALDFYGDGLLQLAIDDTTAGAVIDLETGETLRDLVSNSGLLSADGGLVSLTASAARAVVDSVINNTGNIEANSIGTRNGKIVLGAATAATGPAELPAQRVAVSGTLSASGAEPGETGGQIELTGEVIELAVATIDAFGWSGGGTALVGGDYMGGNGDPEVIEAYDVALENHVVTTSAYVFADQSSSIDASATQVGDGGKIILWSDVATLTAATLSARGGAVGGDGGFVETSGKYLDVRTAADASALNGEAGTWLLDPLDVRLTAGIANNWFNYDTTILTDLSVGGDYFSTVDGRLYFPNGSDSYIDTNVLSAALNAGNNVYVTTRGTTGGAAGDIYVESDIRRTAGSGTRFLVLDAADDIVFSSGVDLASTTDEMHIFLWARDGSISAPNMGQVDTNGGVFKMDVRDGVLMHSDYDSPAIVGLEIFAEDGAPRRDVDLQFSTDKVKFHYVDGVAYVLTDGIRLVDSTDSYFELIAHNLDGVYYDRAVRIDANKGFRAIPDAGFNQGAHPSVAMNGKAEIIARSGITMVLGDEPSSLQAIPVVEISIDGRSATDILAPTSLGGQRLLAQKLAGTAGAVTLPQPPPTGLVLGTSTTANSSSDLLSVIEIDLDRINLIVDAGLGLNPKGVENVENYGLYSILAANAYPDNNIDLPDGWTEEYLPQGYQNSITGFTAQVFVRRGSDGKILEVVAAFAGTDNFVQDLAFGSVLSSAQGEAAKGWARRAKDYYSDYYGDGIIFRTTGDSLGGALAKIAAVEIDAEAIVFNSSPFGSEKNVIASFSESGEALGYVRPDNGKNHTTVDFVDGWNPIASHKSIKIMADGMRQIGGY